MVWSIYVGWNPWYYAKVSNVLDKWAKKYGITIELKRMAYVPSIEAFVSGQFDACVMANMDVLVSPVGSGIDCTIPIIGDYSNDNDQVITKDPNITSLSQVDKIYGVQYSVSDYLLSRGKDKGGITKSINMINTSEDELVGMFTSNPEAKTIVTWNPFVMKARGVKGAKRLFGSADIPGEIQDLLVINTKVLDQNPDLGRALVGAWYEVMGIMAKKDAKTESAIQIMAEVGGSSVLEYNNQLKTTAMFYRPTEAIDFGLSPDFAEYTRKVRNFCVKYDLLKSIKNPDDLGILLPDGSTLGSKSNVKLRFDMSYTKAAAEGKL
jgi:NitT/TauT family transport system substrate-binding protein